MVRAFVVIALLFATGCQAFAGCEADNHRLMMEIQQISNQAQGMGICQAARSLGQVYREASDLLSRCPTLDPSGKDAGAYAQAAEQAQQTANAACQ